MLVRGEGNELVAFSASLQRMPRLLVCESSLAASTTNVELAGGSFQGVEYRKVTAVVCERCMLAQAQAAPLYGYIYDMVLVSCVEHLRHVTSELQLVQPKFFRSGMQAHLEDMSADGILWSL